MLFLSSSGLAGLPSAGRTFIFFLCLLIAAGPASTLWAAPEPVIIKSVEVRRFAAAPPPLAAPDIKPAFKDRRFPPEEAANYGEMMALVGGLNLAQKNFLDKNRFILLPKPDFIFARGEGSWPADEMLANFDGLGGSQNEKERLPANARFIGPDVALHAFFKYQAARREMLEADYLRVQTRDFLDGLLENAAVLRRSCATSEARANWERFMAQLVVPLVILESVSSERDKPADDGPELALNHFTRWRPHFSEGAIRNIRAEIRRVYRAEGREKNLLGLSPAAGGNLFDYGRFKAPLSRFTLSGGRAYHRARVWLEELGWDITEPRGLTDAINFALAMSYIPLRKAPAEDGAAKGFISDGPDRAWAGIMEIGAFFYGYSLSPSYVEWSQALAQKAGTTEFDADSSSDHGLMKRLLDGGFSVKPPTYPGLAADNVVCPFPARAPLSLVAAQELSGRLSSLSEGRPMFSALWISAVWGGRQARDMMPRQGRISSGAAGQLGAEESAAAATLTTVPGWVALLEAQAAKYRAVPDSAWLGYLGAAWFRIIGGLATKSEAAGYPIYMRSDAFEIKRLETIAAALAELGHREATIKKPGDQPPAAPAKKKKAEDKTKPPIVKGLVEPDPLFWGEMARLTQYMMAGFEHYGLFPEDLDKFGALRRFARRMERCRVLAEKELAGEELTEDDYEFIRLFTLDWMALPPGDPGGRRPADQIRSALVTDYMTITPGAGNENGLVIYEATAEPWLMLVLVANEQSPRLALGLAYSHYEFAVPYGRRLTSEVWRKVVYGRYNPSAVPEGLPPPPKNFWYETLHP